MADHPDNRARDNISGRKVSELRANTTLIALATMSTLKASDRAARSRDNSAQKRVIRPTKTGIRIQVSKDRKGCGEINILGSHKTRVIRKSTPMGVPAFSIIARQ
jgi:hypothetical protein